MPPTQNSQTTFKPNLTCIFLSARARYIMSNPDETPCIPPWPHRKGLVNFDFSFQILRKSEQKRTLGSFQCFQALLLLMYYSLLNLNLESRLLMKKNIYIWLFIHNLKKKMPCTDVFYGFFGIFPSCLIITKFLLV